MKKFSKSRVASGVNGGDSALRCPGGRRSAASLPQAAAFSLIEILVTVALLTVIILGLVAMFNQTRKAFTSSFTQVDVLESGRSAADLLAREMEQMAPYGASNTVNFYVDAPQMYYGDPLVRQPLVDSNDLRTNLLQEVFYLTRSNLQWKAVGYRVDTYYNGIGSLYRFTASVTNRTDIYSNFNYFLTNFPTYPNSNGYSRLIDGVVDFRIHAQDTNGVGFGYFVLNGHNTPTNYGAYQGPLVPYGTSSNLNGGRLATWPSYSVSVTATNYAGPTDTPAMPDDFLYIFTSNSVPAYVELELGVVEDRTLSRYNALFLTNATSPPGGAAAWAYLTNHAGQVHLFRQHIPIRNVNPAAYQ